MRTRSSTSTTIAALDPASYKTGWAVLDGGELFYGEIVLPRKSLQERLEIFYDEMLVLLKRFRPEILVSEDQYVHKNPKTLKTLTSIRAAAMLAASKTGADFVLLAPSLVKKTVTGRGNATKEEVEAAVRRLFNIGGELTDNESDAIAILFAWKEVSSGRSSKEVPERRLRGRGRDN